MRKLLPVLAALAAGACSKGPASTAPDAGAPDLPPVVRVTPDRRDVLFTYLEDGAFKTATVAAAVPPAARRQVVVTDLSLSPAERRADRYVYVADLSHLGPDGTYGVAIASRHAFEAEATGTSSAAPKASAKEVVLYTASWCGVCKRAKQLLGAWRVPFVEKDIEASRGAQAELVAKARARGLSPSGVPVIDVAGTLLMGLDEATLRRALSDAGLLRSAGG